MSGPSDQRPLRIREDDVQRLIARAIELDRQNADGLTLEQLRHVAAESGISSEAFEAALREAGHGTTPALLEPRPAESASWNPKAMMRFVIGFGIVLLALALLRLFP